MGQLQGIWKVKKKNLSILYEEAKELKDKFLSVKINHVLRVYEIEFASLYDSPLLCSMVLEHGFLLMLILIIYHKSSLSCDTSGITGRYFEP